LKKAFEICTNESFMQLEASISQEGKLGAFFQIRNSTQAKYSRIERELLFIMETMKEFRNILLDKEIIVYTDKENWNSNTSTLTE
jgi:RNase H-like domain found in reverse transcriptase